MNLIEYIEKHAERGSCRCGKCADAPVVEEIPEGHTVDMFFFDVAAVGNPTKEEFIRLSLSHIGESDDVDPFDGKEHNYIELGRWIGAQDLALMYMGLGTLLGAFKVLSPTTMLGMKRNDPLAQQIVGMGMLTVKSVEVVQ